MGQIYDPSDYHTLRMEAQDFMAIDRKANVGRERLINPYVNLLQALTGLALERVQIVYGFAAQWRDSAQERDRILASLQPFEREIVCNVLDAGRFLHLGVNWFGPQQELTFLREYELRRTKCRFHFDWIMDDSPLDGRGRFTFAHILAFAKHPDLQDVEAVRERIMQQFRPAALQDLLRPVNDVMLKTVASTFVAQGGRLKLKNVPMRTPKAEKLSVVSSLLSEGDSGE